MSYPSFSCKAEDVKKKEEEKKTNCVDVNEIISIFMRIFPARG